MDTKGGSGVLLGQEEEAKNTMAVARAVGAEAREYQRGNWTLPETMLLIEAKKRVHDDRHPADQGLARWRWVEDYCWRGGCRRSQNQCNDRWDNLMRDYKKVRAYEHAGAAGRGGGPSYWVMGRAERKERGLPSNLLREIYEQMGEIVERRMSCGGGDPGGAGGLFLSASSSLVDIPMQASPLAQMHGLANQDQERHCSPESPERKRRRPSLDDQPGSSTPAPARHSGHQEVHHGDDDDHGGDESTDDDEDEDGGGLSRAIGRCAAILSGALESREAAEERRHREVMAVEERRSRARQARREASEQCAAGLAAAVSQLAGSMLALAAKHKDPAAPK